MEKFFKRLIIILGIAVIYQPAYSQSVEGADKDQVDIMIKYFNNDMLNPASALSDSIADDPALSGNAKFWFYRGLIFKEMFKRFDRNNTKSVYREKSEFAFLKELEIEKDTDVINGVKKNINYLAATYYNDAVKLLESRDPDISLSIFEFDKYNTLMSHLNQRNNEKENIKFLNALGSLYANKFNEEKDINADAYYELAKKCYQSVLAVDPNQTSAKYNLVVLETNYKTKRERLLKEESAKKDQVILNLNAVKSLEDEKLIESQMVKERQTEELKILKADQKNKELQLKADSAIAERKDAQALRARERQNTIIGSMTAGLLIVAAFALLVFRNFREKEKLNKELNKLTSAVSNSTNTIWVFNASLELEWVNKNFLNTYGMTMEEFIHTKGNSLKDVSKNPDIENLVRDCINKKSGISYESNTETRDKGKRWFQSMLSPVFNENGKFQNLIVIDSDITDLKNIEEEIREKNKDITDSINYARRIQHAILPVQKKIEELVTESFILYQPKDILSGDLYWVGSNESKSKVNIAAIDCTGHGVPGALLTIMANDLLNTIILQKGYTNPKDIMNELNLEIIKLLAIENEASSRDGMDMAVVEIEQQGKHALLKYAGAHNPLYYIRDNILHELEPIKFNIGSIPLEKMNTVICHTLEMRKDDVVYMFSDGYADQLNGLTGKKFMKGKFKQLLLEIHKKPLHQQKNILEETIKNWRGDTFQTDDMLVMGFRF